MPSEHNYPMEMPEWKHYRVIHSKYPVENLFHEDDEINFILGACEADTSEREINYLSYVDQLDARFGEGWGAVMASFCYPGNGRFSNDSFGAYYCSDSIETAIAEWAHHTARSWREFGFSEDASATVRCYSGRFEQSLVDVRDQDSFHQHDYGYKYELTQAFAGDVRSKKAYGILYKSVRRPGGLCAALLRPPATTPVVQSGHFVAIFNGEEFTEFAEVGKLRPIK